jgi:hypothetical protein
MISVGIVGAGKGGTAICGPNQSPRPERGYRGCEGRRLWKGIFRGGGRSQKDVHR